MAEPSFPNPIRVLCADDHALVRKGIASILANEPDMKLVAEAENGRDAIALFPDLDGIAAVHAIRAQFPDARIIALTSYDGDHEIYRALEAGVRGYLLKEMVHTEVLRAIRMVHAGDRLMPAEVAERLAEHFPQVALTSREVEVLGHVARGLSNKEIAHKLGIAGGTIKIHVQNILGKLRASDRTHAVTIALQRGIIRLDK